MATSSKKGACSSHTTGAKVSCLKHNRREVVPSYVNPNLTHRNREVFSDPAIAGRKSLVPLVTKAEKEYTEKTGQKCQKTFCPFRESVLVIREDTSDEQLMKFRQDAERLLGWKCLGIWVHQDEGHAKSRYIEGEEGFAINHHAHILWDCQDHSTGRIVRIERKSLSKMQDLLSEATGMERGNYATETGRKHRSSQQQRIESQEQRIDRLQAQSEELEDKNKQITGQVEKLTVQQQNKERQVAELEKKIREGKVTRAVVAAEIKALGLTKAVGERLMSLMGQSTADKELKALRPKYEDLAQNLKTVREELEQAKAKIQETQAVAKFQVEQAQRAEKEARQEVKGWERTMQPFKWLLLAWNQLQALAENKYGNIFHPHIQNAITKLRDMFRIPSTERAAGHLVDTCPYLSEKQKDEVWPEVKKDVEIIERWEMRQGLRR